MVSYKFLYYKQTILTGFFFSCIRTEPNVPPGTRVYLRFSTVELHTQLGFSSEEFIGGYLSTVVCSNSVFMCWVASYFYTLVKPIQVVDALKKDDNLVATTCRNVSR